MSEGRRPPATSALTSVSGVGPQGTENAAARPGLSDPLQQSRSFNDGRQPRGQPSSQLDSTYSQTSVGGLPPSRRNAPLEGRASGPQRANEEANYGSAPAGSSACKFYMKTGTCDYGDHCRFEHPPLKKPALTYNSQQLPMRPGEPECSFYIKNYRCGFGSSCKFHHSELVAVIAPPASGHLMPPGTPFIPPGMVAPMGGPVGPMVPAYAASGSGTSGQLGNMNSPYYGSSRPGGAGLLTPVVSTPIEAPIDRLNRMLGAPRGQSGGRGSLSQAGSGGLGRGLTASSEEVGGRGAKVIRRSRPSVTPAPAGAVSEGFPSTVARIDRPAVSSVTLGELSNTTATQNVQEAISAAGSAAPTPAPATEGMGESEGATPDVSTAVDDVTDTLAGTRI